MADQLDETDGLMNDVTALALAVGRGGGADIQKALFAGQRQPPTPLRTVAVVAGACVMMDLESRMKFFAWLCRELKWAEPPRG